MTLGEIPGQAVATGLLLRALAAGRLPHALLFQGAEGTGKADAALALAAAIQCEAGGPDACGECGPCLKVRKNLHPDVLRITRLPKRETAAPADEPEEDEGEDDADGKELRRVITVDQIREMAEHASFAPREGRARVFVIDPADRMNVAAQNALLKTLEEPPGGATIVLVSSRPHALLPTVRSRCLAVRFRTMTSSDLASLLVARGMGPEEARERAALAEGRPRIALALDRDAQDARRARREEILLAIEAAASARPEDLARLPSLAASCAGESEESFLEALDLAGSLLRDASRLAVGSPVSALVHADLAARIGALGERLGRSRAADLVRCVERMRDDLGLNLSRSLLAEALLASVAGAPLPF